MKVVAIVPSAGKGKRLKSKQEKPFVMLGDKPILSHTLKALQRSLFINRIVVVVSGNKLKACRDLVKKENFNKVSLVVRGGRKRFDSVKNALAKVGDADFVFVHDGVRPFVDQDLLKKLFRETKKYGAAILATPPKQTLKFMKGNFFVAKTPKRKSLWEAQTPQAFRADWIVEAYKRANERDVTDDSSLVEKLGHRVKIVMGSYRNIKITTPEDLALARILINKRYVGRRT